MKPLSIAGGLCFGRGYKTWPNPNQIGRYNRLERRNGMDADAYGCFLIATDFDGYLGSGNLG